MVLGNFILPHWKSLWIPFFQVSNFILQSTIKEKVKKITISIVQGDQQNQYTGFGIETSELSPEEMSKVIGHYTENYRDPEMLFQLLGRELKERFREQEERLPEAKKKRSGPER